MPHGGKEFRREIEGCPEWRMDFRAEIERERFHARKRRKAEHEAAAMLPFIGEAGEAGEVGKAGSPDRQGETK